MRATGSVDAIVWKHEALDGFAVHDVRLDDLLNIGGRDTAVPHAIRIDDHRGPVFALVETAGHVRAHPLLESTQGEFLFEKELELSLARRIAATARMSGFALIAADEKVLLELGHKLKFTGFRGRDGLSEGR